jgi:hypothetical protein
VVLGARPRDMRTFEHEGVPARTARQSVAASAAPRMLEARTCRFVIVRLANPARLRDIRV